MALMELWGTWGQTIHDNIGNEKSHDTVPFKYIYFLGYVYSGQFLGDEYLINIYGKLWYSVL